MTVRRQLLLGFGTLVLILLLTGIVSVVALQAMSTSQAVVAHDVAEKVTAIDQLRLQAERLVAAHRGYLLATDQRSLQSFEQQKQQFLVALRDLRATLRTDAVAADLGVTVDDAGMEYLGAAERGLQRRAAAGTPEEVATYFTEVLRPARERLERSLDRLSKAEGKAYEAALDGSMRTAQLSELVVAGATALGFALSIGLALAFSRKFSRLFEAEQRALGAAQRASAAREEILSIVSHDLRNPLAAILLAATTLQRSVEHGEVPQRVIDSIQSAGQRMSHLIETVLASASIEAGTLTVSRQPQSAQSLLQETLKLFEKAADKKGIRLVVDSPDDLSVEADPERLLQVLSNLVGNAIKFSPPSGEIAIGATRIDDCVRFFVRDAGFGIPRDQLPRLFERNWQARRGGQRGLGLGLYIAKQIVELHGGKLWVETKIGAGSTFFFTIPGASSGESRTDTDTDRSPTPTADSSGPRANGNRRRHWSA